MVQFFLAHSSRYACELSRTGKSSKVEGIRTMEKRVIIILGHGSKNAASVKEQETLIEMISTHMPGYAIENAYLQFCQPNIDHVVETLVNEDVSSIVIVPLLLFAGIHVQREIPEMVERFRNQYPHVTFTLTDHLGADMHIVNLVLQRIASVEL